MADRIYQFDKQQGRQKAWHGKTEIIPDLNLDNNWLRTWDLVPRKTKDADTGEELPWVYLRCSDNPAIKIGQPYNPSTFQPVNNADFLEMVKASIGGTPHVVASVGSLRNRGRVFVSIELCGMEKFKAAGREFGAFLNFGNGHDKSSVLWVNTSNICTVCDNTFTINLVSVENKVDLAAKAIFDGTPIDDNLNLRQRHTKNVKLRLPELAKLIDKAVGVQAEFKLELDKLAEIALPMETATQVFAGFIGRGIAKANRRKGLSTRGMNTVNRLGQLFLNGRGNRGETYADAFSAVTDYYSHESSGRNVDPLKQVISSEYGAGNTAKQDFWRIIRNPETRMATREIGEELLVNTN